VRTALNDATIQVARFSSVTHPEEIAGILRWKSYYGGLGACLCIPYLDSQGEPSGYCRLKPDTPRKDKEGKPIKYEAPKGKPNRLYVPPGTFASLADAARLLLITEGEKKAAKADQEGFACVGLSGVWSWQKKRPRGEDGRAFGERELIDDLVGIP
jgi:putative DNA primase/helicase